MIKAVVEFVAIAAALSVYFLPSLLADHSKRPDTLTIALFNAVLGWTIVGWAISLAWALTPYQGRSPRSITLERETLQTSTVLSAILVRAQRRDRNNDRY